MKRNLLFFAVLAMLLLCLAAALAGDAAVQPEAPAVEGGASDGEPDGESGEGEVLEEPAGPVHTPGMQTVAENERYVLSFDCESTQFEVLSKRTGRVFYGYPQDWSGDALAKGANKKLIASLIAIESYNERNVAELVNAYQNCVEKGTYECTIEENGFSVRFWFDKQKIGVVIRVSLEERGLVVELPNEGMTDGEGGKLGVVRVLPFFGAGKATQEGYILLPDGSGAIVEYDHVFSFRSELIRPLYGRDDTVAQLSIPEHEENFALPVYGLKTGEQAFLSVIEEGAFTTNLSASVAGDNAEYFRCMPIFLYREMQSIVLFQNTATERTVNQPAEGAAKTGFRMRVLLLEDEEATYSGMARAYREYLLCEGGIARRDTTPRVDIRLYGATDKLATTLGVPHNQLRSLTTFAQARQIVEEAQAAGVQKAHVLLQGFTDYGTRGRATTRGNPIGKLGGAKGLEDFLRWAAARDLPVTSVAELVAPRKDGNGYNALFDAARSVSGSVAYQYEANRVSRARDYDKTPGTLLKPSLFPGRLEAFCAALAKRGASSVQPLYWGSKLYAERGEASDTRATAAAYWTRPLPEGLSYVVDVGNAYALPAASRLTHLPEASTGYDIETRSIPFYQMVVHGLIPYTGKSSNQRGDFNQGFLKMMEYGAYPAYEWFHEEAGVTRLTGLSGVFSGHYAPWLAQAAQEYEAVNALYVLTEGSAMAAHDQLEQGVYRVRYENGARIYVNYTANAKQADGLILPAGGYAMEAGQ